MLVKCTNPSCSASFRYLRDGRLFRLEREPTLRSSKTNRVEYFWLCHPLRVRDDPASERRWNCANGSAPTTDSWCP